MKKALWSLLLVILANAAQAAPCGTTYNQVADIAANMGVNPDFFENYLGKWERPELLTVGVDKPTVLSFNVRPNKSIQIAGNPVVMCPLENGCLMIYNSNDRSQEGTVCWEKGVLQLRANGFMNFAISAISGEYYRPETAMAMRR